jgi:hypothetical protein
MRLKGYIQAFKENSFTIPVYGDDNFYYYHSLDDNFKIIDFYKTEISSNYFKKTYLSQTFDIGSIGAIIFIGCDSYISCNSAYKNINEIINYLNDTTICSKYLNIKNEALELSQILFNETFIEPPIINSTEELKNIEIKDGSYFIDFEPSNIDTLTKYNLSDYIQDENHLISNNEINNFKESIIHKYLERSILDKTLFDTNKEVMFFLFIKYLDNNKSAFEEIIFDSKIGNGFSSYLTSVDDVVISPIEMSIEETLKLRAEQRRSNLKSFNYRFNNSVSRIDQLTKIPAYKRFGIDLEETPNSNSKFSKVIVSVESKDSKNEQNASKDNLETTKNYS